MHTAPPTACNQAAQQQKDHARAKLDTQHTICSKTMLQQHRPPHPSRAGMLPQLPDTTAHSRSQLQRHCGCCQLRSKARTAVNLRSTAAWMMTSLKLRSRRFRLDLNELSSTTKHAAAALHPHGWLDARPYQPPCRHVHTNMHTSGYPDANAHGGGCN